MGIIEKTLSGKGLKNIKFVKVHLPPKGERVLLRAYRKNKLLVTKCLKMKTSIFILTFTIISIFNAHSADVTESSVYTVSPEDTADGLNTTRG